MDAVLARITGYADYASGVADVDFVIESVAENLDIKKSVWAEVEHAAPKDAILSTNTSGLSPTALQSVLKKPERFVVAHFWNPAQLMPLVEVVPVRRPIRRWWTSPPTSWPRSARSRRRSRRNRWALWATACNWPCCARRSTSPAGHRGRGHRGRRDEVQSRPSLESGRPPRQHRPRRLDVFYNISTYLFDDMDNGTGPSPLLAEKVRKAISAPKPARASSPGRARRQAHHRIPQQGPAARAEERRRGCRRCAGVRHKYQGSVTTMTSTEHSTRADMLAHMGSLQQAAYVRPIEY